MELLPLKNLTNNMVKFMEFLFVILTLYLGTHAAAAAGGDVPLPVTGRVGETVTLTPCLTLTDPIDEVEWIFHVNGEKILLAEFRDQKFIRENKNYFPNRLEGSNSGTALLIRELRMEDSGIYTAQYHVNGTMRDISYKLNVLAAGGGDVPLPVTGRVGETVTLTPPLNLTDPIDRVTWMFHNNGKIIFLAEFRDQKFIKGNENYFPNRLEGSNSGTALLIRELRMEDSGIFTAQLPTNGEMRDINYFLAVFAAAATGGDIPLPVTGRVGETVTLTPHLTLTHPIDRVTWMFHVNGERIILAEFRDQKFIRENETYFPNRLEGSNCGTALLIRELRMEDSGIFTARFLVNGEMRDISYNVTVLAGGGGDVPLPVTGHVGETVSLSCTLNLSCPIDRVTWMFSNNGKRIILAEFRDQKFIRVNENYFPNRLEGSNSGTALLIRQLRMEDSGIFTAQILVNGEMRDIHYNVTAWEPLPIPTPVIEKTLDGNSPDLCHLHCSVPSNSPTLSYSWTYRDTGTDRLYANGSTITVSLKDKALGAEFTCWVQNPAHRNSTSVALYPCGEAQTKRTGRGYRSLIIPMSLLCVILGIIAVYCRKRLIMDKKTQKDDLTYSVIAFPNRNSNQVTCNQNVNGVCIMESNKTSDNTEYAVIVMNNGINEKV